MEPPTSTAVIKEGHRPHSQMAVIQLFKALRDAGLHDEAKKAEREALLAAASSGIGHRMSELLGRSRVVTCCGATTSGPSVTLLPQPVARRNYAR